ncbi:MAG TPA: hypothetical protein EYP08_05730, partial [Pyrodictiaceae archaeon]|nr:hypothetical protein [Pyrodictiaceae archaeon]
MSIQATIRYDDLYRVLEPLCGIKLRGSVQGRPLSKFPLRELVEMLSNKYLGREEYRGHLVIGLRINDTNKYVICHFGLEEPDDFCIGLEGENVWERISRVANELSKLTGESYTLTLSAIVHALQGLISSEEEEIEEISNPDQI